MDLPKHVLLLVGSPKAFNSTSESLAYLLKKLEENGFDVQKGRIRTLMGSPEGQQAMLELVKASDIVVLAFPLYVDSLPAVVIAALELVAVQRQSETTPKSLRLVAIVNNGFPEASQNSTALAICKQFCNEVKVEWAGGLSLGGGGPIGGKPLEERGFIARNVRKSLDLAAADLVEGRVISQQAVDLMAKQMIPKWLYLWMGNRGWRRWAKSVGTQDKLYDAPQGQK